MLHSMFMPITIQRFRLIYWREPSIDARNSCETTSSLDDDAVATKWTEIQRNHAATGPASLLLALIERSIGTAQRKSTPTVSSFANCAQFNASLRTLIVINAHLQVTTANRFAHSSIIAHPFVACEPISAMIMWTSTRTAISSHKTVKHLRSNGLYRRAPPLNRYSIHLCTGT